MDRQLSKLALVAFALALLGVLLATAAGFGHRYGFWHFSTGYSLLTWAVILAVAGLIASLIAFYITRVRKTKRGALFANIAIVITIATIMPPLLWLQIAQSVPRIHDITTDTDNPPVFVAILPVRQDAPNPAEYGGPEIAALQQEAYPGLKPVLFTQAPEHVFDEALTVVHEMDWQVVAAEAELGRIEATDTTFWFGFKDDVVIRITAQNKGSRVDVRSVSRVGLSDVGTNAKRINNFLEALRARLN